MSNDAPDYALRAAELRKAFDASFAEARRSELQELVNVLTLRIESDRYAIALSAIESIAKCPRIVPVPSSAPALLGLAGVRGALLPVYSLARLLNYDSAGNVNWLLLCGKTERLCLAVSDYPGCHAVPTDSFAAAPARRLRTDMEQILTVGEAKYAVVQLLPILNSIRKVTEGRS